MYFLVCIMDCLWSSKFKWYKIYTKILNISPHHTFTLLLLVRPEICYWVLRMYILLIDTHCFFSVHKRVTFLCIFLMFIAENFYCDKCAYSFYLLYFCLYSLFLYINECNTKMYTVFAMLGLYTVQKKTFLFAKAKVMYVM